MREGLELEESAPMGRRILPKRLYFISRCQSLEEHMDSPRERMAWMDLLPE
jgi:hypothetical protein